MAGLVRFRRLSPWGRLVAVSAVVVFGGGAALGIAALASSEQRVVSYAVRGSVNGVMLDVGGADVVIDGGGTRASLGVRQDEHIADRQPSAASCCHGTRRFGAFRGQRKRLARPRQQGVEG